MTTDLRKEFEDFIQSEMPDLLSDDKKKELQECWIAWLRGYNLALGFEVDRLKQKLTQQKRTYDVVNLCVSITLSICCLIVMILLIRGN